MNAEVGTQAVLFAKESCLLACTVIVALLNNAANCYAVTARKMQQTCGLLFLVKSMHDDVALHITVSLYSILNCDLILIGRCCSYGCICSHVFEFPTRSDLYQF